MILKAFLWAAKIVGEALCLLGLIALAANTLGQGGWLGLPSTTLGMSFMICGGASFALIAYVIKNRILDVGLAEKN